MTTVLRFNWPKYVAALGLAVVAVEVTVLRPVAAIGLAWSVTSLLATWWVYDHRQVYRHVAEGLDAGRWASVHAGFDEATPAIARTVGGAAEEVVDLDVVGLATLRRARKGSADSAAAVDALPLATGSLDSLFVTFAVHEVRSKAAQRALFAELRRVLRPGGRLVVTEHRRDLANLAVYGPGALHFQRGGVWRDRADGAGLRLVSDEPITPFVHRMVWAR